MFDLAWSELALIAVVAVVVIGPKDLPEAIRNVAKGVQKLRRMAAEFQTHADELVREAKLEDVRDQIRDIRNFDLKSTIERSLDEDGSIRKTFTEDPLKNAWKPETSGPAEATGAKAPLQETSAAETSKVPPAPPAFVPPSVAEASAPARPEPQPESRPEPPAGAEPPPEERSAVSAGKAAPPPATPSV
ncbi:Sec-independent protein translocase protein TatB [Pseudoroseomonas sp. WGS1072]|uniref:Sec-independent protein translocase protein TatB n=1 Tax=Roseomonas sp. WGS1072 TaxID=3366816 RepID=UPI003BF0C3E5